MIKGVQDLGNGKYKMRVCAGYDDNGKQIKKSFTVTCNAKTPKGIEKELTALKIQYEKDLRDGKFTATEKELPLTFERYFKGEWQEKRSLMKCDDKTYSSYKESVERWALPLFGDKVLTEIKGRDITNLVVAMKNENLADATIRRQMAGIKLVFKRAYTDEIIESNPCDRVKADIPAQPKGKDNYYTESQTRVILDYLDKPYITTYNAFTRTTTGHKSKSEVVKEHTDTRYTPTQVQVLITLTMLTGLRHGECLGVTWNDINIDTDVPTVSVNKSISTMKNPDKDAKKRIIEIVKSPKTASSVRTIEIPQRCVAILKRWREEQEQYSKEVGSYWKGTTGDKFNDNWVFIQDDGTRMNYYSPLKMFKTVIEHYNATCENESDKLPVYDLHALRHSHGTTLALEGENILDISRRLGHADCNVTAKIYLHNRKENNTEIVNRLQEMYG